MTFLLETDRLSLRELSPETDADFIFRLLNTEGWKQFIGDRNIQNSLDAEKYISERIYPSYAKNGFGHYLVSLKEAHTPIGICGFVKRDAIHDIDLGFAFLPEFEGKGYAYESSMAMLHHGKTKLNINPIVAITNPDNYSSQKLLEKLSFRFVRKVKVVGEDKELFLYKWNN